MNRLYLCHTVPNLVGASALVFLHICICSLLPTIFHLGLPLIVNETILKNGGQHCTFTLAEGGERCQTCCNFTFLDEE